MISYYCKDGYVFAARDGSEIACAPLNACVTVRDIQRSVEQSTIAPEYVQYGMVMEAIRFKSVFIPAMRG